jgi:CTD small phosphatase-like protein 2
MFLIIWRVCVVVAPAGSDSPDQAVEAEEVVKQLEIEQVEEIPAGTATAVQDLPSAVPLYPTRPPPLPAQQSPIASAAPPLPPSAPPPPPPQEEEKTEAAGELEPDIDLPPLTGNRHGHRG